MVAERSSSVVALSETASCGRGSIRASSLDARDEPGRAHGDAPGDEKHAFRVAEHADRPVDVVEVVQRLAHAHEDQVEVLTRSEPSSRMMASTWPTISPAVRLRTIPMAPVAQKVQPRAQPDLARHTEGDPRIAPVPGPRHMHGLDAVAVHEPQDELRGAVGRRVAFDDLGQGEVGVGVDPGADLARQEQPVRQPGADALEAREDMRGPSRAAAGREVLGQHRPRRRRPRTLGRLAVPGEDGDGNGRLHRAGA